MKEDGFLHIPHPSALIPFLLRVPAARVAREAAAVLCRAQEGSYYLGAAYAAYGDRLVARVLARQRGRVEFIEPEVVAVEIVVGRAVRVAAQVAVILHADESLVVEPVEDRPQLDYRAQRRRLPHHAARAEGAHGRVVLGRRRRHADTTEE